MYLFTNEWVEEIINSYSGTVKKYSLWYRIITQDSLSYIREEIEGYLSEQSGKTRMDFISKLKRSDLAIDAYHELVAGHFLKEKGFIIEYEKKFTINVIKKGKVKSKPCTPDWYVNSQSSHRDFICEVRTFDITDYKKNRLSQQDQLRFDLENINIGANIAFIPPMKLPTKLDDNINKKIIEAVTKWLESAPTVGSALTEKDIFTIDELSQELAGFKICFKLTRYNSKGHVVIGITIADADFPKSNLANKIQEKVRRSKYFKISEDRGMPLVIIVLPDELGMTYISEMGFLQSLFGVDSNLDFSKIQDYTYYSSRIKSDGLLYNEPLLSAAVYLWNDISDISDKTWKSIVIHNPNAKYKLTTDVL